MTLVDTIINSVWFPLITGIASILGFVLALYPIQIHPLHPSEYRTLQWKKTLLIAAGIGIIISSCIQIYLKVSPKYEWIQNPSADYTIKHDNCSSILLAPQTVVPPSNSVNPVNPVSPQTIAPSNTVSPPSDTGSNRLGLQGVGTGSSGVSNTVSIHAIDTTGAGEGNTVSPPSGTGSYRLGLQGVGTGSSGVSGGGNNMLTQQSFALIAYFIFHNGGIWSFLFLLGLIILILGIVSDPIKLITKRLLLEQKKIEEMQCKCLKEIIGNETYECLSTHKKNEYDQAMEYYTNLQNVIMEMLTGFSRNFSRMEIMMARNNRSNY